MAREDENKNSVVTQGFVDKLIDKIGKILKDQYTLFERDSEKQESIELLLEKVGLIEKNFEELTKSLAKGSYPLKLARSIKVTESLLPPKIEAIAISKSQLIETYNEIVALLSGYIIPVILTPDSYRNLDKDSIILETTIQGNYWVITTLENTQHKYWLVPNNNLKFNIHKLKTVESLFQLKGDYHSPTSEFIVQEPGILSLLPNNKQWKLLQPGVLVFGANLNSGAPQSELSRNETNDNESKTNNKILSNLTELKTKIEQLNNKILHLEIQAEISQKTYQRDRQEWLSEKENLCKQHLLIQEENIQKIKNLKDKVFELNSLIASKNIDSEIQTKENTREITVTEETINIKSKIERFKQIYSQEKKLILDRIVAKVMISVETLENIFVTLKQNKEIILENTPDGKYWITSYLNAYFLIPSENGQLDYHKSIDFNILQTLFDCSGYYPEYSSCQLIKPAVVTKISAKQWKLQAKGKYEFS